MNDLITITLTREQAEDLSRVLWGAQDEGPEGEGWASEELQELRRIVDETLGRTQPHLER